ncbi:MAG: HDOD domain-containing protein [Pseudomonadota bacterium]
MQTIGKFEVLQTLGQGGQGTVMLARDPDLDRKVAIKLLRLQGEPGERRSQLLGEARAVSTLRHPAIVTVFEAGEHAGTPFLVFEYVEGLTLAALIRQQGAIAPERAASLISDALDGLAHAHEAGIVHRDFKPSNILVNSAGKARVMDFGLAATVKGGAKVSAAGLSGTPAYMAPEYIARGEIGPQNDVFAAGLVLFEMLFSTPAMPGEEIFQVLHRIANEPLVLPADAAARVGGVLLDILARATAKDPALRYASAREMQQALGRYLSPETAGRLEPGSGSSTLDFLLRRMRHRSDFPAMSTSIVTINQLASSGSSDAATLSNAILKDLALTNKVLRIANSAYYARNAGGRISTVSRAIVLLGFETVRQLAISLMLFEHIEDQKQSQLLKDEFLRANLCGLLCRVLSRGVAPRSEEQAFICGLFHRLGRLLVQFYFQEEAAMVARIVAAESCSEDSAAIRVLGISLEALGIGIARSWGFPDAMVYSMRGVSEAKLPKPIGEPDNLRALAACASELARLVETTAPEKLAPAHATLLRRYGSALSLSAQDLTQATTEAVEGLSELARVLRISPKNTLLNTLLPAPKSAATPLTPADFSSAMILEQTANASAAAERADEATASPQSILTVGIQDISQWLVDDAMKPGDILSAISEIIYRALGARRVIVCLRDGTMQMRGRYGMGEGIEQAMQALRFALGGRDLFNLILTQEIDVLVTDASAAKIRKHLPPWYLQHFDAQSFIVLPLRAQGAPLAMIYAEAAAPGGISPSAEVLTLLRTLRNQALLVVRQR